MSTPDPRRGDEPGEPVTPAPAEKPDDTGASENAPAPDETGTEHPSGS